MLKVLVMRKIWSFETLSTKKGVGEGKSAASSFFFPPCILPLLVSLPQTLAFDCIHCCGFQKHLKSCKDISSGAEGAGGYGSSHRISLGDGKQRFESLKQLIWEKWSAQAVWEHLVDLGKNGRLEKKIKKFPFAPGCCQQEVMQWHCTAFLQICLGRNSFYSSLIFMKATWLISMTCIHQNFMVRLETCWEAQCLCIHIYSCMHPSGWQF